MFAEKAGIDVYQVIEASNSQPYSHIHRPGISVGGHCIPVYPRLYLSNDPDATIVRAAREANAAMPAHAVERLAEAYGDLDGRSGGRARRRVPRRGEGDRVLRRLRHCRGTSIRRGALVTVHDPLYTDGELEGLGFAPHTLGQEVDAAVLHTDHAEYRRLTRADLPGVKFVLDGRAILTGGLGAHDLVVGRPLDRHEVP